MTRVLMIPGLVCDGTVWAYARAAMAPVSATVADVTTQGTLTEMAASLLDRHAGDLVLMGHSMGGRVAMEMARLAPARIKGMALLNTGIHPQRAGEAAKRQLMIDLANTHGMARLAQDWLPGMMAAGLVPDPGVMNSLTAMVCRMTPQIHENQMRALLSRPDAAVNLGAYNGPMLLITGRQDSWSPVAQHQEIAALCPQAHLHVIENAGHFAPVEQADEVASLLADWAKPLVPDRIPDNPIFDRTRANSGYSLNKMAMGLSSPQGRAAFLADEGAYLDGFALTPDQRRAVIARDWAEMVRLGGNLFYILKISAVDPTPIREIGAAQAGMTLEVFLETRLGKVTNG